MTVTAGNVRVEQQAAVLHHLAIDITRALEHIQRELRACDWHPADRMASGPTSKGGHASPVERVAEARSDLTGRREDLRDWITGLEEYTRSGRFLVTSALRIRTPSAEPFDANVYDATPCKYTYPDHRDPSVTLTCTNWASTHTLPGTNSEVDGWCDDHWPSVCHVHGDHLHEGRRVDGVLCCQRAYRAHTKDETAA